MIRINVINVRGETFQSEFNESKDNHPSAKAWIKSCINSGAWGSSDRSCMASDDYNESLVIREYEKEVEQTFEEPVLDDSGAQIISVIQKESINGKPITVSVPMTCNVIKKVMVKFVDLKPEFAITITDITNEKLFDEYKAKRDALLTASDWTQTADSPLANQESWKKYRTELRMMRKVILTNDDAQKIVWPILPEVIYKDEYKKPNGK